MLIQFNKELLGDKVLDLTESAARSKEETRQKAAKHKIADQDLLEDREMAQGTPLDWTELTRRITRLNPNIFVEQGGIKDAVAVRWATKDEVGQEEKRYVTGFYQTVLPEFDSIPTDERSGLAAKGLWQDRAVRGWRSVLLALVKAGALTKKQVDLTFGPALGQRAVLWDRSMQPR